MNKYDRMIHCPCCGAPVTGNACEYCGCVIYDFADIDISGGTSYVRIKTNQGIVMCKVLASPEFSINFYQDTIDLYDQTGVVGRMAKDISCRINLTLDCIADDGKLFNVVSNERPYQSATDRWFD